jgi:hypothetical protein
MGSTLSGIQCYGFDLGGVGDEWHLKGLGDDGWVPSWAAPEQLAEGGSFDYENAINEQLASAELPLSIVTYGMTCNDYTGYVLAAWSTECSGSKTSAVHLEDVLARRDIERWDDALTLALKVLDIQPWQPHPMFLLAQSYG